MSLTLKPIGIVSSCFKEKFGVPHQSGVIPSAPAKIVMQTGFNDEAYFEGIENFKYLWLIFGFHQLKSTNEEIKKVRPPRLGGQKKLGVFATRSPHRPNPLGISVVEFVSLKKNDPDHPNHLVLEIKNHDLIEGTPIFDIKPYHPQADLKQDANLAWLGQAEFQDFEVTFSEQIDPTQWGDEEKLKKEVIQQMLSRDIRSINSKAMEKEYGVSVFDLNIRFKILDKNIIQVFEIKRIL